MQHVQSIVMPYTKTYIMGHIEGTYLVRHGAECYNIIMEELRNILAQHASRYPLMRPTDAVKLIYQNEFGSGHMVKNESAALERLRAEYSTVQPRTDIPLYEPIGSGLVRLNLAALDVRSMPLEAVNSAFVATANAVHGSIASFKQKIELLYTLCGEGTFAFSSAEFSKYLTDYEAAHYPAVSHSEEYRTAYHPSYRVVKRHLIAPDI